MKLRHQLLIVRKYTKPEIIRGIHVPEAYRTDHSRALWEVEEVGDEVEAIVGVQVKPDWIVVTSPRRGVFLDHAWNDDGIRYERFVLHTDEVRYYIPWTTGEVAMLTTGARLRIKPDPPPERSSIIAIPDAYRASLQPNCGTIIEVGPDVEPIHKGKRFTPGMRVLYPTYSGTYVELNGERMLLMDATFVLMILDEDTEVAT